MTRDVTLASGENLQSWIAHGRRPRRAGGRVRSVRNRCARSHSPSTSRGAPSDTRTVRTAFRDDPVRQLGVLRQRRATVPQGHEPGADAHGARRRRRRRRSAAISSSRRRRISTSSACTRTSPARSCTTPPTSSDCSSGKTSRCSGATRAVSASRPGVRRGRWSTCSATTRACSCGARTTRRSPPTASRASRWTRGARVKLVATTVLPTWAKQVLDRSVAACDRASRRHPAGRAPQRRAPRHRRRRHRHATSTTAGTTATLGGLAATLRRWPRLGRFVSEFGAQAVPEYATTGWSPIAGPISTGTRLARHHALQADVFERGCRRPRRSRSTNGARCTQAYQAALLQLQIEDLRRVKYAPDGRLRAVLASRIRTRPSAGRCSTTSATRSAATARSATRAGRCSR